MMGCPPVGASGGLTPSARQPVQAVYPPPPVADNPQEAVAIVCGTAHNRGRRARGTTMTTSARESQLSDLPTVGMRSPGAPFGDKPGEQFGEYVLMGELGRGG